jgi:hypothetical protein
MRIECQDDAPSVLFLRPINQALNYRAMGQVDAIKVSHGDEGASETARNIS